MRDLDARRLAGALNEAYPDAAPASWNRHVATVRSFTPSGFVTGGWRPIPPGRWSDGACPMTTAAP